VPSQYDEQYNDRVWWDEQYNEQYNDRVWWDEQYNDFVRLGRGDNR
jgi:hypothetical protein